MKIKKIKKPVFLCGMMGTGKSTIGRTLAKLTGSSFHDLDSMIEEKLNMTIPEIFENLGEDEFRNIERKLLTDTLKTIEGVLALGGGSLQNQQITDHIKQYGWLVFIDSSLSSIFKRLQNSNHRPMLKTPGSAKITERIEQLMAQRLPYYSQAHITIKTDGLSKEEIANTIIKRLSNYDQ